jgi:hypothetical protein
MAAGSRVGRHARPADKTVTDAIDTHVQDEQHKDGEDDDGSAGVLVPAG